MSTYGRYLDTWMRVAVDAQATAGTGGHDDEEAVAAALGVAHGLQARASNGGKGPVTRAQLDELIRAALA